MKFIYLFLMLIISFFISFFVISPEFIATLMTIDDSYFYIKTAANMAKGLGSTFDGINQTNGYHPLYFLLLTGLSYFFPLSGLEQLPILLFVEAVLLILLSMVIFSFLKTLSLTRFYQILVTLSIIFSIGLYDVGLETRLNILLVFLLLKVSYACFNQESKGLLLAVSGMMPLCFLARVDNLILLFSLGAIFCCFYTKKINLSFFKTMTLTTLPLLITVGLYAILNKYYFGIYSSISSLVKLSKSQVAMLHFSPQILFRWIVIFSITLFFGIFCFLQLKKQSKWFKKKAKQHILMVMGLFNVLYLSVLAFKGNMLMNWYFMLPLSFAFIFCAVFFQQVAYKKISPYTQKMYLAFSVIVLLAFPCLYAMQRLLKWHDFNHQHLEMALWIKANLGQSSRIYQVDRSGRTGFISERSVINGDGLINSYAYYQDVLIKKNFQNYVKKWDIRYLIFYKHGDIDLLKHTLKKSTQVLYFNDYFVLVKAPDISSI